MFDVGLYFYMLIHLLWRYRNNTSSSSYVKNLLWQAKNLIVEKKNILATLPCASLHHSQILLCGAVATQLVETSPPNQHTCLLAYDQKRMFISNKWYLTKNNKGGEEYPDVSFWPDSRPSGYSSVYWSVSQHENRECWSRLFKPCLMLLQLLRPQVLRILLIGADINALTYWRHLVYGW